VDRCQHGISVLQEMMISRSCRITLFAAGVLILALLVPSLAQAKPAKITGKLSARGYTVIALAGSGEAKADRARRRKFKLRPPAKRVTLQLRAPDATYAGPIVVAMATTGEEAIVGVRAGAKLGRIEIDPASGYAELAGRLPRKYVDLERTVRTENGVPIGAGNLGRVLVGAPGGPSSDLDLDGVPAPVDVDDDGDVILDRFDRDPGATAARTSQVAPDVVVGGRSLLNLDLPEIVNANAPGLTEARIEAALPSFGTLILGALGIDAFGQNDPPVELDCGDPDTGLVYCRRNDSTGKLASSPSFRPPDSRPGDPFPRCCDRDGDGFGSLGFTPVPQLGIDAHAVSLLHGATRDEVRAGDLLIARVGDGAQAFTGALSYVFQTTPALVSYTDEAGNSQTISYPVTPGSPGTKENPFIVSDGPDPDPIPPGASGPFPEIEVTLTFWRPQREALPEEPGEWIDVGHTVYVATRRGINTDPSSFPDGSCPPSAYSETDPNLTPTQAPDFPLWFDPVFGLEDSSDDQPASPANTFSFTLNLTRCFGLIFNQLDYPDGLYLRAQPANPLPGPPDSAGATVAWFRSG
jgi:hypothetical protein